MPEPRIVLYRDQQLEQIALQVLSKFHIPPDSLPVDIELITERDFQITVMPFSGLQRNYGIEAYVALSRKNIYVDQFLMNSDRHENRYRFTIAEELSHALLHRTLYEEVRTPEEYFEVNENIKPELHDAMDKDAKHLAGALLMPGSLYRSHALSLFNQIDHTRCGNSTELQATIAKALAGVFNVSPQASWVRFGKLRLSTTIRK